MKIAVIGTRGFPGVQGGIENHCEQLYTHMKEDECDVTVFTRKQYVAPNTFKYKNVSLVPLSCPSGKYLEAISHSFKSVFAARKLNPDFIHSHGIGPSVIVPLCRLLGMKVIVTNHGPEYRRKKWPFFAKLFLRLCEWMSMRFATGIIAVSGTIAQDVKERFNRRAYVIPNGVEMPERVSPGETLKKYGLEEMKYIISVGRIVPEKGFDDLIDAFASCKFSGWKLCIVGGADHEDRYSISLKAKAKAAKDVVLTGFVTGEPLRELYSNAGLFVLSSYHEGLPIALLEAMSYGLSCVASNIPANKNIELSEERFFKVGDIESLKDKLEIFIEGPMTENERDKQTGLIAAKYNWSEIAKMTLEVYRDAA
jgi:glycosyltransferase involved in cell wall biosynthesis